MFFLGFIIGYHSIENVNQNYRIQTNCSSKGRIRFFLKLIFDGSSLMNDEEFRWFHCLLQPKNIPKSIFFPKIQKSFVSCKLSIWHLTQYK